MWKMATINSFYSRACALYVCESTKGTRSAEMLDEIRLGKILQKIRIFVYK